MNFLPQYVELPMTAPTELRDQYINNWLSVRSAPIIVMAHVEIAASEDRLKRFVTENFGSDRQGSPNMFTVMEEVITTWKDVLDAPRANLGASLSMHYLALMRDRIMRNGGSVAFVPKDDELLTLLPLAAMPETRWLKYYTIGMGIIPDMLKQYYLHPEDIEPGADEKLYRDLGNYLRVAKDYSMHLFDQGFLPPFSPNMA